MDFFKPCATPVNRGCIGLALIDLAAVFDRQFKNKEEIAFLAVIWEEALSSITNEEFVAAYKFYIQTERVFPKPIDILEANRRLKLHHEEELRNEMIKQERELKESKFNQQRLESARRQNMSDEERVCLGISLDEVKTSLAIMEEASQQC